MLEKRDKYFIELALTAARGSKCRRAQYGSVLVSKAGTVIGTAYNGKPAGSICDHLCFREGLPPNSKEKPNCCLHSEVNVLLFSNHLDRQGGSLYVTGKPCKDCALTIMNSGIARLVFWAGLTAHGHQGNSDDSYWSDYGVPIVRVPFTYELWEELYGRAGDEAL